MSRSRIQCIFSAHDFGVSGPRYHFSITSCRTDSASFAVKIKKYGQCCQFVSRIIHSSMKEYNDLEQRLMKIEMKNLVNIRLFKSIRRN